ncbi:DegT/DnrJ/EryC1/StrS family aminotransferase [Methylobacterium sp. J-026]|uniref:DegT/DnrJ/EryC1/StrS family aminotransferase n=1 Tax=Methylobacterium sp. J-026 TaxID=2836624 RepID=UPI001FB94081|nr:DegT/DnrJ/EryC1/StrS family aminotransferase [Methylobacterium sp. J-026]MCJ2134474.1 DegT/DnrJ/EryC1/StrS family aminotransferase [Methylobacterium sp. J-026]
MMPAFSHPIFITKPMLPPLSQLSSGMERVYQSGNVTNMGPMHQELELELRAVLGGHNLVLYNNGTIALMAALQALDLPPGSEVITTPFSFAATTHSIKAVGLQPVFADIEPEHLTLDPVEVRKKITDRTRCILAVHVYGFPCRLDELAAIAAEHDLRLIYDAAHAFAATVGGRSIADFGDASVFSFHATKLFNTIEGGAVSTGSLERYDRLKNYRNFGIIDEDTVDSVGLNGKMSEVHALFGLLNLRTYQQELSRRRDVRAIYTEELSPVRQVHIPDYPACVGGSYQYFPIRIEQFRDVIYHELKRFNVFSRRYFYPLIADFKPYRHLAPLDSLPEARKAAQDVLCLPFYGDLADGTARSIAHLVRSIIDRHAR